MTASTDVQDGVLLICKPAGCTSFEVVRKLKGLLPGRRIGHTGTLDPMATGLLPITIGEATKLSRFLSGSEKRYRARVRLGTATDTLNREGKVVAEAEVPALSTGVVEECLGHFRGHIEQVPPMHSALHHHGKRMYQLARAGLAVERKPRPVHISRLDLLACGAAVLEFDVTCSAGTYVRVLAADIAVRLGTVGHLESLERTEAGGFGLSQALELASLDHERARRAILPLEQVLERFPRIEVTEDMARQFGKGQRPTASDLAKLGVALPKDPAIVWFTPPGGSPIVLARLDPSAPPDSPIEILRVLRPQ